MAVVQSVQWFLALFSIIVYSSTAHKCYQSAGEWYQYGSTSRLNYLINQGRLRYNQDDNTIETYEPVKEQEDCDACSGFVIRYRLPLPDMGDRSVKSQFISCFNATTAMQCGSTNVTLPVSPQRPELGVFKFSCKLPCCMSDLCNNLNFTTATICDVESFPKDWPYRETFVSWPRDGNFCYVGQNNVILPDRCPFGDNCFTSSSSSGLTMGCAGMLGFISMPPTCKAGDQGRYIVRILRPGGIGIWPLSVHNITCCDGPFCNAPVGFRNVNPLGLIPSQLFVMKRASVWYASQAISYLILTCEDNESFKIQQAGYMLGDCPGAYFLRDEIQWRLTAQCPPSNCVLAVPSIISPNWQPFDCDRGVLSDKPSYTLSGPPVLRVIYTCN